MTAKLIPYDASKHAQDARGRWRDRSSGSFVRLDPSTVPGASAKASAQVVEAREDELRADVAPAPAEGPATDLEGVELPHAEPAPVAEVASTTQPTAAPSEGPTTHGGTRVVDFGALPSMGADEGQGASVAAGEAHDHHHGPDGGAAAHIDGCWKGASEGRICACGVRVYTRPAQEELDAMVAFHAAAVNALVPHGRPYSASEREGLTKAFELVAVRYGNPLAKYTPILALVLTTGMVVAARQEPQSAPKAATA